jgi:hypothetical protein
MRESICKVDVEGVKTTASVDLGANPMATVYILGGVDVYSGIGLNGYLRNAHRKSGKLQSKRDTRGNMLMKVKLKRLNDILNDETIDAKVKNKAQSVYNLEREKLMEGDAICKSWKRQKENIKKNKEQACSVAREELASFLSLFDIVIIGKNDFRKWMQGVSHAASSVLSDLSLGKLVSKIKFKVSLTVASN